MELTLTCEARVNARSTKMEECLGSQRRRSIKRATERLRAVVNIVHIIKSRNKSARELPPLPPLGYINFIFLGIGEDSSLFERIIIVLLREEKALEFF